METDAEFPSRLRWWRKRRGLSQLDLANGAEVSQRHVSFLELGRTRPSRDMVLRLAGAMALPFRQQNALLLAAGYAPVWREGGLGAPELSVVSRALDYMLEQQEPYPALVVDRRWNVLRENRSSQRLTGFLADSPPREPDPAAPVNLADVLLAPDGLRPLIVNWREVALGLVRGVHADALADGTAETAELLNRLLDYPDVPKVSDIPSIEAAYAPVLTIEFARGETSIKLFTTIATLGTPNDITVQEIRIESFFPADDATAALFREWAEANRRLV